jgi:hypothetical protein
MNLGECPGQDEVRQGGDMASDKSFVDFVTGQIDSSLEIRSRKMFSELPESKPKGGR